MEIRCLELRVSQDVLLESFDRSTALYMPADDFVIAEPSDWKTFVTGEDGCYSDANAPFAQRAHLTGVFAAPFIFSIGVSVVIIVIRGFINSAIELWRYEIEFLSLDIMQGLSICPDSFLICQIVSFISNLETGLGAQEL